MRRLLFLLILVLLAGLGTGVFAAEFADVTGTPYATAFADLARRQVVEGYPDGSGRPNAALNRAEALKVVLSVQQSDRSRVQQIARALPPLPLFSDVDQRSWYAPYVELGFERGITTGYPDGSFRPGSFLKVEEAIAMLMRAYGESGTPGAARLSPYIQNRDHQWFTAYVNAAIEKNLLMHQERLIPGQVITRGQFFDMVYRMVAVQEQQLARYTGPEPAVRNGTTVAVTHTVPPTSAAHIRASQPASVVRGPLPSYASEKFFAITMPTLGIKDLSVIHPSDPLSPEGVLEPLRDGVGHLFSYPGGGGKVMIYGHSSSYPWDLSEYTKIFRRIADLAVGDRVYVTYDGKLYVYEVTHERTIAASDTAALNDDGSGEELILYTCWPPDSVSQRYLVHAVPVQTIALR